MSLAKALKKSWSGDIDIEKIIDTEVLRRPERFDIGKVKEDISALFSYATGDKVNMDEFMKLFFRLYQSVYAEQPRKKGVFHPSGLSTACERALFYEFTDVTPTESVRRKITGQTQRTFDVGTWWHTYIQMILWKAGILEASEVEVVDIARRISGRGDGILKLDERALMEIKTMNSYSYSKGKYGPFPDHEKQAGVYATELGLKKIVFIYINKDTSEIKVHVRGLHDRYMTEAYEKMNYVLEAVKESVVPVREVCSSIESPSAKTCAYATWCFRKRGLK